MHDAIEVNCGPNDFLDGTYEVEIDISSAPFLSTTCSNNSFDVCRIQIVMPRTGVPPEIQDECAAIACIIKMVAAEFPDLKVTVNDPSDFYPPASDLPPGRLLIRDQRHIRSASIVVVVANYSSTGMGDECHGAVGGTIPRVLIYRSGTLVSPVLLERITPTLATVVYESIQGLVSQVRKIFPEMISKAVDSKLRREQAQQAIWSAKLPQELFIARLLEDMSLESLAEVTDIPESQLRELERDPRAWIDSSSIQIQRLAQALGRAFHFSGDGPTSVYGYETLLPENVRKSLVNYYNVLRDDGKWVSCDVVLQCWKGYRIDAEYLPEMAMTDEFSNETSFKLWNETKWSERLLIAGDPGELWPDI